MISGGHRRNLVLAIVLSAAAHAPLQADVRLVPAHGVLPASVRIRQAGGIWAPIGPATPLSLNPTGDRTGDGAPATAQVGTEVLAAWIRPGEGVLVALGDRTWYAQRLIDAPSATFMPVTTTLDRAFVAAWQELQPTSAAFGAVIAPSGEVGEPIELGEGTLIGIATLGADSAAFATLDLNGELIVTNILFSRVPEPSPVPWPESRASWTVAQIGITGVPSPGAGGIPSAATLKGSSKATPDIRVHSGDRHGDPYALLTWWTSPQELHWVELTEDGPAFPVEVVEAPGNAEHPQSLVRHAIDEAARR